jgi:hypothetical protein
MEERSARAGETDLDEQPVSLSRPVDEILEPKDGRSPAGQTAIGPGPVLAAHLETIAFEIRQ